MIRSETCLEVAEHVGFPSAHDARYHSEDAVTFLGDRFDGLLVEPTACLRKRTPLLALAYLSSPIHAYLLLIDYPDLAALSDPLASCAGDWLAG